MTSGLTAVRIREEWHVLASKRKCFEGFATISTQVRLVFVRNFLGSLEDRDQM